MAYDLNKLTKLQALKDLAMRVQSENALLDTKVASLSKRVDEIVSTGGEPNVITEVKVNGTALPVADKAVDVTVPTKTSELDNDSLFQTQSEVAAAVASGVAAADHLQRKKVAAVSDIDPTAEGADKYIYMVPKTGGKNGDKYDEYMVIDGEVEPVGDWAVDLSGYVEKQEGYGLYPDADKEKLAGIAAGATKVAATAGSGTISINGTEVTLFEVATDAEVTEMLNEVFGAPAAQG